MTDAAPLTLLSALAFVALALGAGALAYRRSWLAAAAIVATAPFAWYHQLGPTEITLSKAAFVGALFGVALALARDPTVRSNAFAALRSNRALLALAALAVWSAASALWAGTPAEAIREAFKWVWYGGAFALTIAALRDRDDDMRVLLTMFAAATAVGVYGLWQSATSAPAGFVAPNGSVVGRIAGTLEGPNQFGAYLESMIPPLLAVLLFARLPRTLIVIGSLVLGLLCADLVLTYSRGALWSSVGALAFVTAAYLSQNRRREAPHFSVPVVIAICAALVFVPVAHNSIGAPGWQHEMLSPTAPDTPDSTERRRQLWTCALELFARHPIAGVGAGNFADAKQQCGAQLAGSEHFNANEWYLETAADLGVVGLLSLGAFVIALLAAGRGRAVWREPAAIGAYAVLIAFVLHGFVDDVVEYPKAVLSFFVLAAMLSGVARRAQLGDGRVTSA